MFRKSTAEIFVPDGIDPADALRRTTHLILGAHQDDIEIMALEPILTCFGRDDAWVTGVVITDGSGSARDGIYASYSNADMMAVRRSEQKKAAVIGEYGAQVFLDWPSTEVKDANTLSPMMDMFDLMMAAHPDAVYCHNPADKHPTHVACAVRSIQAIRCIQSEEQPSRVYGCEVWRGLDWLVDSDKIVQPLDAHESLANALVGVFDSQIEGGKRYDLASLGRRRANATFLDSHAVDNCRMASFAMDLTPLVRDLRMDIGTYVTGYIDRFRDDVSKIIQEVQAEEDPT